MDDQDENSVAFLLLPTEIVVKILLSAELEWVDILKLTQTCKRVHEICQRNDIWKRKFSQRWPAQAQRIIDLQKDISWIELFRGLHKLSNSLIQRLQEMSPLHFQTDELSTEDFSEFSSLSVQLVNAAEFMIDELRSIINSEDKNKCLTYKYYARKVIRHLHHSLMKEQIREFVNLPTSQQHLENGAILVAQWEQPTEECSSDEILDKIQEIVSEVKMYLRETNPHHPVLKQDEVITNLLEDRWNTLQCKAVLEAIRHVMYTKLGFHGNKDDYYDINNSFIDKVLKKRTGIPIIMSILYAAVARKLGVICKPVNSPMHFLLRWEHSQEIGTDGPVDMYIDAFDGGKFLPPREVSMIIGQPVSAEMHRVTPCEVIGRMVRNLISIGHEMGTGGDNMLSLRDALELSLCFDPTNFESCLLLVRVHLHLNINLLDVIGNLDMLAGQDQARIGLIANFQLAAQRQLEANKNKNKKTLQVKSRNKKSVLYSVGMVMRHKRYNYNCMIYGWDQKCEASRQWIIQMGVHNLPNKDKQPFYNVLVEDGTMRYAAEENLEYMEQPHSIGHEMVGRYFQSFEGTHYLPNAEKAAEYPDDVTHTERLVHEHYHS